MAPPFVRGICESSQVLQGCNYTDIQNLSSYQYECIERLSKSIQLEEETYLMSHPEIAAMLKIATVNLQHSRNMNLKQLRQLSQYLTKPAEVLDMEIKAFLNIPPHKSYERNDITLNMLDRNYYLALDLQGIHKKHNPLSDSTTTSEQRPAATKSSSFLSFVTSASTPATPEPEPVPVLTMEQIIYNMIVNSVNKATMLKVTEFDIKYDMAYVELMGVVENAMELTVVEIKEDIRELYETAYTMFENIIIAQEEEAAAYAWENRMRKKLKKLLRRQKNFKGYETPPTPKSQISVHPSYKISPQRVCECHPKPTYNRYPKDRYGIYLPTENEYEVESVTVYPDTLEKEDEENEKVQENVTNKK